MRLDMYASEEHFFDHLQPIWNALPEPGLFIAAPPILRHAQKRGIAASPLRRDSDIPVLVASYGDIITMRKSGRKRIAFIEHGIGQSYAGDPKSAKSPSYPGGRDRDDVGLFLVPNEHAANRWRKAYPRARVAVVGSPKLDAAPVYEPEGEPIIALSWHWDGAICSETHWTYPHYAKALPEVAKRYRVIGHGHPRAFTSGVLARYYQRMGIEVVKDFREVLRRAALYVIDNSSSLYEFAATGRPVLVLNSPKYRREVHHGLRFWEASHVGLNIERGEDLLEGIATALRDEAPLPRDRENALSLVYQPRQGGTVASVTALEEWTMKFRSKAA